MIIEVRTFRVAGDEATFLAADKNEQQRLMTRNRGMLRRTAARGENGEWLVLTLWDGRDDMEEPSDELAGLLVPGSAEIRTYEDLGG